VRLAWSRGAGGAAAGVDWHDKAIALLEPLVAADPRVAEPRQMLALAYQGRGKDHNQLGRWADGFADLGTYFAINAGPDGPALRARRAAHWARQGRAADAV